MFRHPKPAKHKDLRFLAYLKFHHIHSSAQKILHDNVRRILYRLLKLRFWSCARRHTKCFPNGNQPTVQENQILDFPKYFYAYTGCSYQI